MDAGYNHSPVSGGAWVGSAVGACVGAAVGWAGVPEYHNNIDVALRENIKMVLNEDAFIRMEYNSQ